MQASLFDDPIAGERKLRSHLAHAELTARQKLLLLTLNFIPLAHVAAILVAVVFISSGRFARVIACIGILYLLPPALGFAVRKSVAIREGEITYGSKSFFAWWALLQMQMLFSRLPALEELLRLVPGLYSAWLRLWGAKIGRLTFWSPGTMILDRSYVDIGDDVIFGAGVRINPHVFVKNAAGISRLLLGTVKVGDGASVGGYSLLTSGAEIAADEVTDALLILLPFSLFKDGKRIRPREPM